MAERISSYPAAGGRYSSAMTLATVDHDGLPNARMVLLKDADARGFVFYTNLESRKGDELKANPHAALLFHWKSLRRQVRVRGTVEVVADAEADADVKADRPGLSAEQQTIVLKAIDDDCGDTWCEGDFNYRFKRLSCDFSVWKIASAQPVHFFS